MGAVLNSNKTNDGSSDISCRICNGNLIREFTVKGSRYKMNIDVLLCEKCDAYYTNPMDYDYECYDFDIIGYYVQHSEYIKWRHNVIFDFVESMRGQKKGKFLDLGSGAGYSLHVANARGWDAVGVEPSKTLVGFSREQLGVDVIHGFFSKQLRQHIQSSRSNEFDYILIDNVLEHIKDPVAFLGDALALLKKGGLALIAVPPVDWLRLLLTKIPYVRNHSRSAQLNLFYDPEQHVNYFSRTAMRVLVENQLGFRLDDTRFHHSALLNGKFAELCGFETGYYFISRPS